jgi:hypothetical protein
MGTPYLRKRQTSTVSPAKPGDYSLDLVNIRRIHNSVKVKIAGVQQGAIFR